MVKKALVFVSDPHPPVKPWKDHEYNKANTFMEGLMSWGWVNANIITVGDQSRFMHGNPTYSFESNTRKGGSREYNRDLDAAYGLLDGIQDPAGKVPTDAPFLVPPHPGNIDEYVLWISDNCPVINGNLNVKQRNNVDSGTDPRQNSAQEIIDHLEKIHLLNGGKDITVIFSGEGSVFLAKQVEDTGHTNGPRWRTISSHDGNIDLDSVLDEFNIGIIMPQTPAENFNQAYWEEVARLNGIQSPQMWPIIPIP